MQMITFRVAFYRGNRFLGVLYVRAESRVHAIEKGLQEWQELISDIKPTKITAVKL